MKKKLIQNTTEHFEKNVYLVKTLQKKSYNYCIYESIVQHAFHKYIIG